MNALGKIYLSFAVLIMILALGINTSYAGGSSKSRLIKSIEVQQKEAEKNIVNLWMSGERGKELELALSEYVTLEVRQRALTDNGKNKTLLVSVSGDPKYKPDNGVDLAREIVLEYYKRKGIDLKGHRFVKGTYLIRLNN